MLRQQMSKIIFPCLVSSLLMLAACVPPVAPSSEELVAQFPSVGPDSVRDENPRILCPFQRMLERSGLYDAELSPSDSTVAVNTVKSASQTFGCGNRSCGPVADQVSAAQGLPGEIDLELLHDAGTISHECGLTFDSGGTLVSDTARDATLTRLGELADPDGHLVFADLQTVKQEICAAQGVSVSSAGAIELRLIYAYLGGVDNGYIALSDVDKFLHAEMPATKTSQWVNSGLLLQVQ